MRVSSAWMTLLLLATPFNASHAALSLNSTRLVFVSDKTSASTVVRNPSKQTYAVQAWVNTAEDMATIPVPFIASPHLFRLGPGDDQQLQINALPNTLPTDRESLFYLNVQEIPQTDKDADNVLNIALRTRIKLFYRPHQITGSLTRQINELKFSFNNNNGQAELLVENPTPFHITFRRLEVNGKGQHYTLKSADMLLPLSTQAYPLTGIKPATDLQAQFTVINDFGGNTEPVKAPVSMAR